MKPTKPRTLALRSAAALAAGAVLCGLAAPVWSADPKPAQAPSSSKKKLTGQELYALNCNRCHPERYPTEFTPAQWKTIMLEMRVRANIPAAQAREILKYLQEDSGTP